MKTMKMIERFPTGYVFSPSNEQIVEFYLYHKIVGSFHPPLAFPVVDLYDQEPWKIWQQFGGIDGQDLHLFTKLKKNKSRIIRKVGSHGGTWSGETSSIPLFSSSSSSSDTKTKIIGSFKRFHYENRKLVLAPDSSGFSWIMFEYTLDPSILPQTTTKKLDPNFYVACKIRKRKIKQEQERGISFGPITPMAISMNQRPEHAPTREDEEEGEEEWRIPFEPTPPMAISIDQYPKLQKLEPQFCNNNIDIQPAATCLTTTNGISSFTSQKLIKTLKTIR